MSVFPHKVSSPSEELTCQAHHDMDFTISQDATATLDSCIRGWLISLQTDQKRVVLVFFSSHHPPPKMWCMT